MSASKHKIFNEGETKISGVNAAGAPASMTLQVAGIKSKFGSVRVCEAGNRVSLKLHTEQDIWVQDTTDKIKWGVLSLDIWAPKEGFHRQGGSP